MNENNESIVEPIQSIEESTASAPLPDASTVINPSVNLSETREDLAGEVIEELPIEADLHELADQLDQMIQRIRESNPDYSPPPYTPQRFMDLLSRNLPRFSPRMNMEVLEQLRSDTFKDLFDPDTWKGVWYVINYVLEYQADMLKRRVRGEYETDEWGYDPEFVYLLKPFFEFLYKKYWRVQTSGIENVPEEGRALLVANHSGQLPFDGSMIGMAILTEHSSKRMVRTLYASWFSTVPVISSIFTKVGQALANEENGVRLLEQDQLVSVFPEGIKGVSKLYKDRYKLMRFGRGGFVRMALRTGAPMIPVSVVGAEETYISIAKSDFIARLIGFPFFPISITWPWFGLFGFVPIPSKWFIDFGDPITTSGYGSKAADNMVLVSQLSDQVRNNIQKMVYTRLSKRKSVLFG